MSFHSLCGKTSRFLSTLGFSLLALLLLAPQAQAAAPKIYDLGLHSNDGYAPFSNAVLGPDGNYYGTLPTSPHAGGLIYKVTPAGQYTTLHTFYIRNDHVDGANPYDSLLLANDGNFYGLASSGGNGDEGVLYKITPDGVYTILHHFADGSVANDGYDPEGALMQASDGLLYGSTRHGGTNDGGTLFKIALAGTGYSKFHDFSIAANGTHPQAPLLQLADGMLYGVATEGGNANGDGTLFKIAPSGSGFTRLAQFNAASSGCQPVAGLTLGADGNLYGTARECGAQSGGTIYRLTLGTTATLAPVLAFNGTNGLNPSGTLVLGTDNQLYGTTEHEGGGEGTVFKITTAGVLTKLHSFNGDASEGTAPPRGKLILLADGSVVGTTYQGGAGRQGTLFSLKSGTLSTLFSFFLTPVEGMAPHAPLLALADGSLLGTTYQGGREPGGNYDNGTVFKVDPVGNFKTLFSLDALDAAAGNAGGSPEFGSLATGADGNYYGVAPYGGAHGVGYIFRMTPTGTPSVFYSFNNAGTGAYNPTGGLLRASDGNFYGTASTGGGSTGSGAVYQLTPAGVYHQIGTFNGTNGATPKTTLIQASDGKLYGLTNAGGATSCGTFFRLNPGATAAAAALTALHSFNFQVEGCGPLGGSLIQGTDGNFYGTTFSGTPNNVGAVIKLTAAGAVTVVHSFNTPDGSNPIGTLLQAVDGNLYGTTSIGGTPAGKPADSGFGTVFKLSTSGSSYRLLKTFGSAPDGGQPNAGLVVAADGNFYGTTSDGGAFGSGTVYMVDGIPAVPQNLAAAPGNARVTLSWDAAPRAFRYNIYRGTAAGGEALTPVASNVSGTSYTNIGLTNNTKYYFKITGVNDTSESALSAEVNATPIPPPPAPTNVQAVAGTGQVNLSWTAAATAASYNVYVGTTSNGETIRTMGISATNTVVTGLTSGTQYFFKVAGVNAGGTGVQSSEASASLPPGAPTLVKAKAGNAQLTLTWKAPVGGADSYSVYQGTSAGMENATPIANGITHLSLIVKPLNNGTAYFFKVAAVKFGLTGAASAEVSGTPLAPPAAPTSLTAVAHHGSVTLNWTASANAASYNIYQGTSSNGEGTTPVKTGIRNPTAIVSGLSNGTAYFFKVQALNASGKSGLSNETSATPTP